MCWRARNWLARQSAYVKLEFVGAGTELARERFPRLDHQDSLRLLHVVADDGRVWRGAKAWGMCLWALRRWRGFAMGLSSPGRLELAQHLVVTLSNNRHSISGWLGWKSPPPPSSTPDCESGACTRASKAAE